MKTNFDSPLRAITAEMHELTRDMIGAPLPCGCYLYVVLIPELHAAKITPQIEAMLEQLSALQGVH